VGSDNGNSKKKAHSPNQGALIRKQKGRDAPKGAPLLALSASVKNRVSWRPNDPQETRVAYEN